MTWAKLDDRWPRHPKAVQAGPLGRDLFVCGLCYCNEHLTDGFIPEAALDMLAPAEPAARARNGVTSASAVARRLVAVGLWETAPGGWRVHDYHDWNPTADEVAAKRASKRDRMIRWRRGASRDASNGQYSGASRSASTPASPPDHVDAAPTPTPTPTPQPPLSTDAPQSTRAHPREAFNWDCPRDRRPGRATTAWPGTCVNAEYFDQHPDSGLAVRGNDGQDRVRPKQCPHHREQDTPAW